MRDRGFSLVEALVAVAIVLVMAAVAVPPFRAHFAEAHLVGAGQQFKSHFRLACSAAVRSAAYTAIRFERRDDGTVWYAVYEDGDEDGVLSADILSGRDRLVSGPFPLSGGAPGVRVGINPGIPALPPETRPAVGRPRALRRLGHPVLLAAGDGDARHVLPGRRRRPGRGARDGRQRPRAPHGLARRRLAGEVGRLRSIGRGTSVQRRASM